MKKIFISHSSKDKNVADEFIDLLTSGLGISINEIFCTSTDGAGIGLGDPWREMVKKNIESAIIVFFIVSSDFKLSQICQNELGAAWIIENKKILPLVLYPITPDTTGELLSNLQAARLSHSPDVEGVKNKIQKELPTFFTSNTYNDTMWANKKERFINNVKEVEVAQKKTVRWRRIKEKIKKVLMWSSILIPIILIVHFYHLAENKDVDKRMRIYKAASNFEGFDLKLEYILKKSTSPVILANNFEEAIPFIKDMSSKSLKQYNLVFDFSMFPENVDSIDVLFSRSASFRLNTKMINGLPVQGLEGISIASWRRIELSADVERNFDRFRHSADGSCIMILNLP